MKKSTSGSLGVAIALSSLAASVQANPTNIPAGAVDFTQIVGESCLLYNLGGSFCSVQGDCGKKGHIDSGASAVGKAVGTGPLVNATGFNAFNRYVGIVNGTKRLWFQVGAAGANNCKITDGAYDSAPINVGDKQAPPPTNLAPGAADFSQVIGESCLLYNLGGSFCSVQGDCGKNGHIDSGASAVGKSVGGGPMVNATGFNAFNRYVGIVNGTKRLWFQVGATGANNCKIIAGAYANGAIHVGDKAP